MPKKQFDLFYYIIIGLFWTFVSGIFLYDFIKYTLSTTPPIATHVNTIPTEIKNKKHLIVCPDGTITNSPTTTEPDDYDQENTDPTAYPINPDTHIFFTPDDPVRESLLGFIQKEQKKIDVAIFAFTDQLIAQALIDAHTRGVIVELVTDPGTMKDRNNKSALVVNNGVKAYIYNPQHGKKGLSSAMHHKFMVFHGTGAVWTGSCNFTRAGCESNQEHVVLLHGSQYVRTFHRQFNKLKKRSYQFQ